MNESGCRYTRMCILCFQNTNYRTAIPHQLLVENEAMWPQGVHRYCRSYLVCEERENNFFLTLGA